MSASRRLLALLAGLLLLPAAAHAQTSSTGGITVTATHVQAPFDNVPRFCNPPNVSAVTVNTKSGNWSDPSLWPNNQIPGTGGRVQIAPNTTVTYDLQSDARLDCIEVQGRLAFATSRNTRLYLNELMVMPSGALTIGTTENPLPAAYTAEIIFNDTPLKTGTLENPGIDPQMYGKGLLVFGDLTMHGSVKAPTFVRVAQEPQAGDTTIFLREAPRNWQAGDKLIIPDTRHRLHDDIFSDPQPLVPDPDKYHGEEVVVRSITGTAVTLAAPLRFTHECARDPDAAAKADRTVAALANGEQLCPHAGNLTRNIVFRSENPAHRMAYESFLGQGNGMQTDMSQPLGSRAHAAIFHRANVDIRYVLFKDMGRTTAADLDNTTFDAEGRPDKFGSNQVGRYSVHFHHVYGTTPAHPSGYQMQFVGNAIDSTPRWGLAIHDTHYALVRDNVVYDARGAGIVTEDGNESYNVIEHNFAVRSDGSGRPPAYPRPHYGLGHDGSAFWFRGANNVIRRNVGANSLSSNINVMAATLKPGLPIPLFPGADTRLAGQFERDGRDNIYDGIPSREFSGNESYGAAQNGIEVWQGENFVISDSVSWHNRTAAIEEWYGWSVAVNNLLARGDVDVVPRAEASAHGHTESAAGEAIGIRQLDDNTNDATVSRSDIQGFTIGIDKLANRTLLVSDTILRNQLNVFARLGRARPFAANRITLQNVGQHSLPGRPLQAVVVRPPALDPVMANTIATPQVVEVLGHNGEPGRNYQLFAKEQAPDYIVPISTSKIAGCPEEGLTNQECFDKHGVAWMGQIATCTDTLPEIDGFACPAADGTLPGATPAPAPGPAQLTVQTPAQGSSFMGPTVQVRYTASGDMAEVNHVHFSLDGAPEIRDIDFDGRYDFMNVPPGQHLLTGYLARGDHQPVPGTDVSVSFTTTATAPTLTPTPTPTANTAPTLTFSQDITSLITRIGQLFSLHITATDPDGDPLNLTIQGLPAGAVFE